MKFESLEKLRLLVKLQSLAKLQPLVKYAIVALVISLAALILLKPRVNGAFHADYLANLNRLEALTGELHRDHLLVRQGLIKHYDFLEADLQMMERAAQLALLKPKFAKSSFDVKLKALMSAYTTDVSEIRKQVEISKRSIGLLTNARRAFRQFLGDLNKALTADVSVEAMLLVSELEFALIYKELDADWLQKVNQLVTLMPAEVAILRPMVLHARMINVQQQELEKASAVMYTKLNGLSQPKTLKLAYLDQFYATVLVTNRLLWLSYASVALLLALCAGLIFSSNKARKGAQITSALAQKAQIAADRRLVETQLAVTQCNEALEMIGRGEFDHRLECPFEGSLELLREGINQTADSVEFTMVELTRVMQAVKEGRFDVRLDERVQGTLGMQVDETISSLDTAIGNICQVMDDMRDGCFSTRVDAECLGRLDELKSSINESMSVLDEAIGDVVELVQYQAEGDFNRSIKVTGKGQLELLATSINSTSAKVHELVGEIRQVSQTVAISSDSMKANSRTWCEHTAFHSDSIGSLMGTVDRVKQAIRTNCASVEDATVLVSRSQEESGKGMNIANEAVSFMKNINVKSVKIATITRVLDKIASQTNLLALNAAVEAARAGDHGSGFSVVATEVKDLARKSAEASTDITALINATMKDIESGSESVENTGQALKIIESSILDVEKMSRIIVDQSHAQDEDMDSIVSIVNETRNIITEDLEMANEINDTSENLGVLVQRVNQLLSFFQTDARSTIDMEVKPDEQAPQALELNQKAA